MVLEELVDKIRVRAIRVRMAHCELKWGMSDKSDCDQNEEITSW